MDNSPLVSIAIPVFNSEKYLEDAICSVLNQTYCNFELLLINDGSSDASLSVIKRYASNDDRIIMMDDGTNMGLITRLNQSIKMAHGKYYARMDADDIMCVTRIEKQVAFLESHKDIDVIGSSAMLINNKNEIVGSGDMNGVNSGFIHPSVMGKTEWFKNNPYADWPVRAEDTELWLRTGKSSVFYNLPEPLLFYREFGVPSLKKYLKSQKTLRKIFSNYRTYGKSFSWKIKNTIASYVKSSAFILLSCVGKTDMMIKRRRKPLPNDLLLTYQDLQAAVIKKN